MTNVLDKVRAAKKKTEERLSRGGGSGGAKFWRPEAGENKIRIMPAWDEDEKSFFANQFWREVAQHWRVSDDQKGPILCPKVTPGLEGDCPICEFVDELKADKTNVDGQRLAKDLKAKTAYLLSIVVLKDPVYTAQDVAEFKQSNPERDCPYEAGQTKVQIYACPVTVMDDIFGLMGSAGADITALADGRELTIKKIPNKDPMKTRYQVYPAFQASAFDDSNLKLPALDQVGFQMEYDKMLELLQGGKGGEFSGSSLQGSAPVLPISARTSAPVASSDVTDLEEQMRRELAGG
jgi:hypothetical protein